MYGHHYRHFSMNLEECDSLNKEICPISANFRFFWCFFALVYLFLTAIIIKSGKSTIRLLPLLIIILFHCTYKYSINTFLLAILIRYLA